MEGMFIMESMVNRKSKVSMSAVMKWGYGNGTTAPDRSIISAGMPLESWTVYGRTILPTGNSFPSYRIPMGSVMVWQGLILQKELHYWKNYMSTAILSHTAPLR